jgi:hypothetical protein
MATSEAVPEQEGGALRGGGVKIQDENAVVRAIHNGEWPKPEPRAKRENPHQDRRQIKEKWFKAARAVNDKKPDLGFQYSELQEGEIRLLTLHPGKPADPVRGKPADPLRGALFHCRLDKVFGCYEALSYCWGLASDKASDEITIKNLNLPDWRSEPNVADVGKKTNMRSLQRALVDVGGTKFPIRKNLYDAMVRLRGRATPVTLWVDAICIDQTANGKTEKQMQLKMMAKIFNYASNVCVWLGDSFDGSADGIQLARDMMNFQKFDRLLSDKASHERWLHLVAVLQAAWFSRRWIIQEIALARSASVHLGDQVIHWDDLAEAVSLLLENIENLRGQSRDEIYEDLEMSSACILVQTLNNLCRKSDDGRIIAKLFDVETLVSTLLGFQATYSRDAIYSILSLARDPPEAGEDWEKLHRVGSGGISLHANYDFSTRDLFIAFVTRCIQRSGSLDIICRHWAPPVTDEIYGQEVRMPTWVSGQLKSPFGLSGTRKGRQNGENFVAYLPHDRRRRYNAAGNSTAKIQMLYDRDSDCPPEPVVPAKPAKLASPNAAPNNGSSNLNKKRLNISITGEALTSSPMPSPSLEKPEERFPTPPPATNKKLPAPPQASASQTSNGGAVDKGAAAGQAGASTQPAQQPQPQPQQAKKLPPIEEEDNGSTDEKGNGKVTAKEGEIEVGEEMGGTDAASLPVRTTDADEAAKKKLMALVVDQWQNPGRRTRSVSNPYVPPIHVTPEASGHRRGSSASAHLPNRPGEVTTPHSAITPDSSIGSGSSAFPFPPVGDQLALPPGRPRAQSGTKRRASKAPMDVEHKRRLSGILSVSGFVIGTVGERSDVMRGGIIPGDWVENMGWDESDQNRVPDLLWRLLVADRTERGDNPPPWYKRACLHGLVDSRVTDGERNVHSVTPPDRRISENTTKYFKRVESVVWNRRLFAAKPVELVKPEAAAAVAKMPASQTNGAASKDNGKSANGTTHGIVMSPEENAIGPQGLLYGLGPRGCDRGDLVCILFGCSVPVILKPAEDRKQKVDGTVLYELVGEAYVHGVMDGEALEEFKRKGAKESTFALI